MALWYIAADLLPACLLLPHCEAVVCVHALILRIPSVFTPACVKQMSHLLMVITVGKHWFNLPAASIWCMFTSKIFPFVYCDMLPSSGQHVQLHKHDNSGNNLKYLSYIVIYNLYWVGV